MGQQEPRWIIDGSSYIMSSKGSRGSLALGRCQTDINFLFNTWWCHFNEDWLIPMDPQHHLGIYVGYNSPSITRFIKIFDEWSFTARLTCYYFDETLFSSIRVTKACIDEKSKKLRFFSPNQGNDLSHLNPHTLEWENDVIKLQISVVDIF